MRLFLIPAASLLVSACSLTIGGRNSLVVDDVELPERHEEALEVGAWHADGLAIEANLGDLRLERSEGPNKLVVTLHETVGGDAWASYEDGVLVAHTRSGEPVAIGDVLVLAGEPLPSLRLTTGLGDLEVRGTAIEGDVWLTTGMGDVGLRDVERAAAASLATGMGDVTVDGLACVTLAASSGMGRIEVRRARVEEGGTLSTGMGDVVVRGSCFDRLEAETGMGSVDCKETEFRTGSLDSGLGRVSRH